MRIGDGCYRKQKELGQFCDWLNESLVHVYKEQKLRVFRGRCYGKQRAETL